MSDLTLNNTRFHPSAVTEETKAVNAAVLEKFENAPLWYEIGAAKFRAMSGTGETGFPAPAYSDHAVDIEILSREDDRKIPCRLIYPAEKRDGKGLTGVLCHFHGGGWVLGSERAQDGLLQFYANAGDVAVISIGYRLAPEYPYPAPIEDCVDAVGYLIANSEKEYGAPLRFLAGESAGAHLSVLMAFHFLKAQPSFSLTGLILPFGIYDISGTPSVKHFTKRLVLNREVVEHFASALLPHSSLSELRNPLVSPLYEDFKLFTGKLPPALFTVGTDDPLVDDSVFMAAKWGMAGGVAILKVYEGAAHGFYLFPSEVTNRGLMDVEWFMRSVLGKLCKGRLLRR